MSEKIYALLLRLYPAHFRQAYGEEALQLFRDRARDEQGFLLRLRLWLDLLTDFAVSFPREYRRLQPALGAAAERVVGAPCFYVLSDESLPPSALLMGCVLSLVALGAIGTMLTHARYQARQEAAASANLSGHAKPARQQSPPAKAQGAAAAMSQATAEEGKLDAAERQRVVDAAIANLRQHYIYPEVAEKMAAALRDHQKRGDYEASADGSAFAVLLTTDLREVSQDRHLAMIYSRDKTSDAPDGPSPEDLAQYKRDMERTNCMFEKAEILPGNIGYLKFNEFPDPPTCQARMEAAMHSLQGADAIIFDVRDNHGGSPEMVALIAAYLFDRPTHLNDIYNRGANTTQEFWARPVMGNKLADKPAYVLTSASTFSAAEEFSYDLKMLKRATLVGETTRGGGHLASMQRIDDHFLISVPDAKPINPISKTNWEGTGVEPDVKVKAADALQTAKELAEAKLRQRALPNK